MAALSARIYHYGLKAGLPFPFLRSTAGLLDAAPQASDFLTRKRLADEVVSGSKWAGFLPRDAGYTTFGAGEIEPLGHLFELGKAIYERHSEYEETERAEIGKSPISHLISYANKEELAQIADLATHRDLAEIMCGYFGSVPRFDNADIWISRPNKEAVGSQLFHLDKPDRRYTSIFLNISDVTEKNGPFVLLDKPDSDLVRQKTNYESLYYHKDGRLPDSEIKRLNLDENLLKVTGPAGAGGIVDTSECMHCGSRCEESHRVIMILSYMHAHKPGIHRFEEFADRYPTDKLRRLMLGSS